MMNLIGTRGRNALVKVLVTSAATIAADGASLARTSSTQPSGTRSTGWIGINASDARAPMLTGDDWSRLGLNLRLSALQWEASWASIAAFRADEAHDLAWPDDLQPEVGQFHPAFPAQRRQLAAAVREHRASVLGEVTSFFSRLREDVLSVEQRPANDLVERACLRRVRLGTIAPCLPGLDLDPDWRFLGVRHEDGGSTPADLVIADLLLESWRAEADALARRLVVASDRLLGFADSPWGVAAEGAAHIDDFAREGQLGRELFDLQNEWVRHRQDFAVIVAEVLSPDLIDDIMEAVGEEACDHRRRLPEVDPAEVLAAIESALQGAEAVEEFEPATFELASAVIREGTADADRRLESFCAAWLENFSATYRHVPLLGPESLEYTHAHRIAGRDWVDAWIRLRERLKRPDLRAVGQHEIVSGPFERFIADVDAVIVAWDRLAAAYRWQ